MTDVLEQVRAASEQRLYYVALMSALSLPDICAALESHDGLATGAKYIAWFDRHVSPRYSGAQGCVFSGNDVYLFRCSMLHQGRTQHPSSSYKRIVFVEPGTSGMVWHMNTFNDMLNIDVELFVSDIVKAVESWLPTASSTPNFQANYPLFVNRYQQGIPPFVTGSPVIG